MTTKAGKDMGKEESLFTIDGSKNGISTMKTSGSVSES